MLPGRTPITKQELILEFMINALRLTHPITTKLFTERTGLPITMISKQLNQAQAAGLLTWNSNYISTTATGKRFLNELEKMFVA